MYIESLLYIFNIIICYFCKWSCKKKEWLTFNDVIYYRRMLKSVIF